MCFTQTANSPQKVSHRDLRAIIKEAFETYLGYDVDVF